MPIFGVLNGSGLGVMVGVGTGVMRALGGTRRPGEFALRKREDIDQMRPGDVAGDNERYDVNGGWYDVTA